MTLNTNYVVKYGDLIDTTVDRLASICNNIDAYSSNVPSIYRTNGSQTLASASISGTTMSGQSGTASVARRAHTAVVNGVNIDALMVVVAKSTLRSQLLSFAQSSGIATKFDEVMSTKALMHFFNVLASFISARVVLIHSPYTNVSGFIFYNGGNVTYPTVTTQTYTPT